MFEGNWLISVSSLRHEFNFYCINTCTGLSHRGKLRIVCMSFTVSTDRTMERRRKSKQSRATVLITKNCLSILKYSCLLSIPQQFSMTLVLLHLDFQVWSNFKMRPIKSSGKEYLELLPWIWSFQGSSASIRRTTDSET